MVYAVPGFLVCNATSPDVTNSVSTGRTSSRSTGGACIPLSPRAYRPGNSSHGGLHPKQNPPWTSDYLLHASIARHMPSALLDKHSLCQHRRFRDKPCLGACRPLGGRTARCGFGRVHGLVLIDDHLADVGVHHLFHRLDLIRTLVVKEIGVRIFPMRHHRSVEFISGIFLGGPVTPFASQFHSFVPFVLRVQKHTRVALFPMSASRLLRNDKGDRSPRPSDDPTLDTLNRQGRAVISAATRRCSTTRCPSR